MPALHEPDPLEAAVSAWPLPGVQVLPSDQKERDYLLLALGRDVGIPKPDPPAIVEGQPIRAGYRLLAQIGEVEVIEPVFAQALAAGLEHAELTKLFDHLWGVDLAVWRRLGDATHAELAQLWLTSPGRRLVRRPETLEGLREPSIAARVDAAAILEPSEQFEVATRKPSPKGLSRWFDLHRSIPGGAMQAWAPKHGDGDERDVPLALARLERGSPHSLRGAALGWLLGRAADRPHVEIDGVHQNLRESLPGYLAIALQVDESHEDFSARLEEQALQHAALIAPASVRRAWHIARWIHGCLVRSPFAPGREEALHAKLMALLPSERAPIEPDDPLHPSRFGFEGLRIADLSLVAGAWAHYGRDKGEPLQPPPLPLVNALRRLAERELSENERAAELALARGHANELRWTAQHVAPPWVARWLLTQWRIDWLDKVSAPVVDECLQALRDGSRFDWFAHVARVEGPRLPEPLQARAHELWRAMMTEAKPRHDVAASLAIGLQARLDASERELAFVAIEGSPLLWQPFLWGAWAESALGGERMPIARPALDALLELARSASTDEVRLNAALLLLRRTAQMRGTPERAHFLAALAELGQTPPFRGHPGLTRELRRLGALPTSAR